MATLPSGQVGQKVNGKFFLIVLLFTAINDM